MEKIVKISVSPSGDAKIEVDGVKGPSCKDIAAPFEDIYSKTLSYADKPEMHEGAGCAVRVNA